MLSILALAKTLKAKMTLWTSTMLIMIIILERKSFTYPGLVFITFVKLWDTLLMNDTTIT